MARERADYSCDLLPYYKTFRDFKDVKYSFSDKVIYRKRKRASRIVSVSGAKVCHKFIVSQSNC